MPDDAELLRRYAATRAEAAFVELVRRHLDGVYSAALRRVGGDTHLAEDVAQQVFVALAQKAGQLSGHPVLAGWLHAATRHEAAHVVRHERRRKAREQEAQTMHDMNSETAPEADWSRVAPVLDEALDRLSETERTAVLLRFVERRPFGEIADALRLTEDAARMRVNRALDKLRGLLARRGVASTAAALSLALTNHVVAAAPASLASAVTGASLAAAPLGASAAAASLLSFMSTTKAIFGIAVIAMIAALGTATYEIRARHAAEAGLAAAGRDYDMQVEKLRGLEQRAQIAEQGVTQLKKNVDEARAARAEISAPSLFAEGRAFLARHAEAKKALVDMSNASLNYQWAPLYRSLNFTPAQIEEFQALMRASRGMSPRLSEGMFFTLPAGDVTLIGKAGSRLRDLLGEDGLRKCQEFGLMIPARELTAQVAGALSFTETPLTAAQSAQLVLIIAGSRSDPSVSQAGSYAWDAVVAQAQGLLSAPQLVALTNARAQAGEQTMSLKWILNPIPAPGAPPPICK
jgi:RNA polymerase sigma factor (sigma-70 family)